MRSVIKSVRLAFVLGSACAVACVVVQPQDGDQLEQSYSWTVFSGFVGYHDLPVTLDVRNVLTGAWEPFATLPSAHEPTLIDSKGRQWFPWGDFVQVPQGARPSPPAGFDNLDAYWTQVGTRTIQARTRARVGPHVLDSLDAPNGFDCLATEYGNKKDGVEAVAHCKSNDPIIKLTAPCGGDWQACCLFAEKCVGGGAQCDLGRCVRQLPIHTVPTHPDEATAPWSDDGVQGVTHDQNNWYIVSTTQVFKIPVSYDLASGSYLKKVRPFPAFAHLGDPEFHDGVIYVPLEQGPQLSIGALDPDLNELGVAPIPGAGSASWCAIHPDSGRLYTSDFNATVLRVYKIHWDNGFSLEREFDVPLRLDAIPAVGVTTPVPNIQGGAFGPHGVLYLVSDVYEPDFPVAPYAGGILGVVAETGVDVAGIQIAYNPFEVDPTTCDIINHLPIIDVDAGDCRNEELEGITYWDVSTLGAPFIQGNLHVMQFDNFPSREYWFKHFRVDN